MSRFLRIARELLEVACAAAGEDCDWTLVLGRDGAIRVATDPGWQLDGLRVHYGAEAAYRVHRAGAAVHVTGVAAEDRCELGTGGALPAPGAMRAYLADRPAYRVQPALPAT